MSKERNIQGEGDYESARRYQEETVPVQATPSFLEIDKDKNGFISATESIAVPGLSEQMIVLDENSDGLLSPAEFAAPKNPLIPEGIPTEDGASEPHTFE